MLNCILTKNVITSCSVTMMLFLHLEVKPLMTLTTVLYLSCALISWHLAMILMELTKRRYASFLVVFNSFFFSRRRRHTISLRAWSSDVCSSDLVVVDQSLVPLLEQFRGETQIEHVVVV